MPKLMAVTRTASRNTIDRLGIGVSSVSTSPTAERRRDRKRRIEKWQRRQRQVPEPAQTGALALAAHFPRYKMDGDVLRPAH